MALDVDVDADSGSSQVGTSEDTTNLVVFVDLDRNEVVGTSTPDRRSQRVVATIALLLLVPLWVAVGTLLWRRR